MKRTGFVLFLLVVIGAMILSWTNGPLADDSDLFITQIPPDALIILDKSGSMNRDPAGNPASYPIEESISQEVSFETSSTTTTTVQLIPMMRQV